MIIKDSALRGDKRLFRVPDPKEFSRRRSEVVSVYEGRVRYEQWTCCHERQYGCAYLGTCTAPADARAAKASMPTPLPLSTYPLAYPDMPESLSANEFIARPGVEPYTFGKWTLWCHPEDAEQLLSLAKDGATPAASKWARWEMIVLVKSDEDAEIHVPAQFAAVLDKR